MTNATLTASSRAREASSLFAALLAAALGLGIVMLAGHVQAAALHDAAHDMRHVNGFPCH